MARSRITLDGLPHSEIFGSKPVCGSPKLIAAYHVLHRRPAPRHPPYALSSLTTTSTLSEICSDLLFAPALPRGPLVARLTARSNVSKGQKHGAFARRTPPVPYYALKRIFGCQ